MHRQGTEEPNDYEKAISAVTEILVPYIQTQKFLLYGFGGIPKYLKEKHTSHCFHLDGKKDPRVDGVDGILKAYRHAIQNTTLGGPTNLSMVLGTFLKSVKETTDRFIYHILLILTDGYSFHDH